MFERFSQEARAAVVGARTEAHRLHSERIGTEHLLLALLDRPTPTSAVLARHGLTREAVTAAVTRLGGDLDAQALGTFGIDLDAVRDRVEATFGRGALDRRPGDSSAGGHLPFDRQAKKVLELSLRETLAMRQKTITDGHIALGLIREGQGLATAVIADGDVDRAQLAREIRTALLT
ncbi:Clp protease N-terminal domain-containing protein [Trujillonella endophytica]|uniref:Clp amino terminal domain-containing protein, pathogenicity island component n=1 Tax=Trujillonella endophytica TaxID=673521 RepID=A0A1H8QXH4_9ACTN|nr:Clp protease N-terminal domain-containing protein [Trujillella endophytica]SEO58875.1 Clp amino terminal domain-containing protein, pathogenicity island component [Trujillella endophytica]